MNDRPIKPQRSNTARQHMRDRHPHRTKGQALTTRFELTQSTVRATHAFSAPRRNHTPKPPRPPPLMSHAL